ncbi:MAG TPA: hypothetical protein VGK23_02475 [Methanomassiliicoccales archaeon]
MAKARAISVYIGGAALIGCGILMILNDTLDGFLWVEILAGLGLFGGGLFEFLGLHQPLKDERIARIGTRAATYSWYSVLVLIGFMAMVYGMGGGYKIGMPQAVGSLIIVMVISMVAFNWYLGREGDVE